MKKERHKWEVLLAEAKIDGQQLPRSQPRNCRNRALVQEFIKNSDGRKRKGMKVWWTAWGSNARLSPSLSKLASFSICRAGKTAQAAWVCQKFVRPTSKTS